MTYRRRVITTLTAVIVPALLATVITLGGGIGSMAHGGAYDRKHSAQIMGVRVGLQGLTFTVPLIALVVEAL
jgi:hypothetical protein